MLCFPPGSQASTTILEREEDARARSLKSVQPHCQPTLRTPGAISLPVYSNLGSFENCGTWKNLVNIRALNDLLFLRESAGRMGWIQSAMGAARRVRQRRSACT